MARLLLVTIITRMRFKDMLNETLNDILAQMLTPVTPDNPFNEDLFNMRVNKYKVLLDNASIDEIMAILKNKIFMTSSNENWNFVPIDLAILTYKQLFNKLELPDVLSQFASYISFISDAKDDLSNEIYQVIEFIKI